VGLRWDLYANPTKLANDGFLLFLPGNRRVPGKTLNKGLSRDLEDFRAETAERLGASRVPGQNGRIPDTVRESVSIQSMAESDKSD